MQQVDLIDLAGMEVRAWVFRKEEDAMHKNKPVVGFVGEEKQQFR